MSFAIIITVCGTASAATPHQITTINSHNNYNSTTLHSNSAKLTAKNKKIGSKIDPVISGTVTILEYTHVRNLANATIVVNSTSGRTLGITQTDANGHYALSFYSTDTSFKVTAYYVGCNPVTATVPVTVNATDGISYGTGNIQVTPLTAYWDGSYGYKNNLYITYYDGAFNSGQLETKITGSATKYMSYCIDIYTEINPNNLLLVNGPLPGTSGDVPRSVEWGKVNYILTHYNPANNNSADRDNEGAAIQAAIWYYTSSVYGPYPGTDPNHPGYYQFMTAPNDAKIGGPTGANTVRLRAFQIINEAQSMIYPSTINVTPKITRIANGGSSDITATVKDNNGNPISGITVTFSTTGGTLSSTTRTTNAAGQATVTLSGIPNSSSATVTASVTGNYGNLLYDNQYGTRKQNLASVNLLPLSFQDICIVNSDVTANVALSQTVNSPVNVGDTVSYIITAHNNGPNTATGILINDLVPSGLSNVIISSTTGTVYQNGVWTIPTLANGANVILNITGTVTSAIAGSTTTNTATRTAQDQYNSQPTVSAASFYTKLTDLVITNTGTTPVNVGDTGRFTVTVTNRGPDTATNINIHDILPTGFTAYITAGSYDGTTWTIDSLAKGGTATLTFTKTNIPSSMAGTTTTNHATATWTEYPKTITIPDSSIHVNRADVALSQTVHAPVNVGDSLTYKVTAFNYGPDTATNIVISDVIPSGLLDYTVLPSIGTYSDGVWTIPSLSNLESATLTITGTVSSSMAGKTTNNTATRTSQSEYNSRSAVTKTGVYTKLADIMADNYPANGLMDWDCYNAPVLVMDLINLGPNDASNVVGKYILPEGFIFNIADTRGTGTWSYDAATRTITWNLGFMPSGGAASMDIFGLLTKTGTVTTIANVTHSDLYDPNTSNNIQYLSINVPRSADIQVRQTSTNYNPGHNEDITLHLTATNNGPDTAHNININDALPAGLTLISADTHGIGSYSGGIWTIPSLSNGTTATLDLLVKVTGTGTIINTASKEWTSPDEFDWNYNNNAQKVYLNANGYVKNVDFKTYNYNADEVYNWDCDNVPTYVMDLINTGTDDATGVIAKYVLPDGLIFKSADTRGTGTWSYDAATRTITWNVGFMPSGGAASLDVVALVTKTGPLTAVANVTYSDQNPNPNKSADLNIFVDNSADIQVAQTASNYTPNLNDNITLHLSATNNGPDTAHNININDALPAGLTLISADTHGIGSYSGGIWTIPSLSNGATATLDLLVKVTGTGTIINTASKEWTSPDEFDWNYNNNGQEVILQSTDTSS